MVARCHLCRGEAAVQCKGSRGNQGPAAGLARPHAASAASVAIVNTRGTLRDTLSGNKQRLKGHTAGMTCKDGLETNWPPGRRCVMSVPVAAECKSVPCGLLGEHSDGGPHSLQCVVGRVRERWMIIKETSARELPIYLRSCRCCHSTPPRTESQGPRLVPHHKQWGRSAEAQARWPLRPPNRHHI